MATETADRGAQHRRSLKVTATASLAGVAAGVVTPMLTSGPSDRLGVAVVIGAVLAVLGLLRLMGVDVDDFSTKDHLYVAFMAFALWFMTWTIMLETGATL
ncbi:MAG: hypothetical protein U5J98_05745 [Halobacteriales archaeon]|nr:hypothetical protein [Halobacteriales archaeon]